MKNILLFIVVILFAATIVLWLRYGGGEPYPDLSTAPVLHGSELDEVLAYPEPIGGVAVSRNGRVFFTVHPEARPQGNRLLEYVEAAAVPYPDLASQLDLFDTVLGIAIDRLDRLWTIDHGNHGLRSARILAFDLRDGSILHDQALDETLAPKGSLLQDLQVSEDGRTVIVADASFWRKSPAIVVYDVGSRTGRRVLENDRSVSAESYVINSEGRAMSFLGGALALRGGIDGIALGPEWLYFGALSGSGLYRLRLADLRNASLSEPELASRVERYSDKPLSDGFSLDVEGNVLLTDVEHNAVVMVNAERSLATLIKSPRLRWPNALSFGPDGQLYVAEAALSEVVFRPKEHIESHRPYRIFRFRPGVGGIPGR